MRWPEGYIAVDWGTTNRRAYLLDGSGELVDGFADDRGVSAMDPTDYDAAVAEIRHRLGDHPMLLAGMIGSRNGWSEASYVPCPASPAELAGAILWVEAGKIGIVPGLSQRGSAGADVMRGEEVQAWGALSRGLVPPDATICHPGTHAKWISLEAGRITAFRTRMTGEMFSLLANHSILSPQLQGQASPDEAFCRGVDDALAQADLLGCLFRIRAQHLLGETVGEPASYASGLLIGSDIKAGIENHRGEMIALLGQPDLCALYAVALQRAAHRSIQIDGADAFVAGIAALVEMA